MQHHEWLEKVMFSHIHFLLHPCMTHDISTKKIHSSLIKRHTIPDNLLYIDIISWHSTVQYSTLKVVYHYQQQYTNNNYKFKIQDSKSVSSFWIWYQWAMGSIIANKRIGMKSTTAVSDTHWEIIQYQQIHKWTKCNKNQWHKY